jgi:hypothetical protein
LNQGNMPDDTGNVGRVLQVGLLLDQLFGVWAEEDFQFASGKCLLGVALDIGPPARTVESAERSVLAF